MGDLHTRYEGGNLVYWDTHRKRIVDAVGADVVKVVEDFVQSGLAAADAPLGWTVTLVETGGGESTITLPDAVGGALLLTTDAFENDGISMQLDGEAFELTSDQRLVYFGIRLQISDATQSDLLVGLCITDTALLGGMTDGVYFRKVDGSTSLAAVTEKNSTETETTGVHTMVAATDVTLEFYFDGTTVEFFVNGVSKASHATNIVNDEFITPSVEVLTGEAAAKTMQVDWVRAIQIGR